MLTPVAPIFIERSSEVGALLLHSYTSTPNELKSLAEFLAIKNISVYVPVIAGHGTSPDDLAKTKSKDWQNSVDKAYQFMAERYKKIYIIENSFGGSLAFDLATRNTKSLAGIVSLSTPIKVRWQKIFKLGLYTYGIFKKHQKKVRSVYRFNKLDWAETIYPVMPVPNLRQFFSYIKKVAKKIQLITVPTLIVQASRDRIVDSRSADYIFKNLKSTEKRIVWIDEDSHWLTMDGNNKIAIFSSITNFINQK